MASRNSQNDTFDGGQYGTLRYDFTKWSGKQGVIPDPSDELIEQFMRGMRDTAKEYQSEGGADVESLSAAELQELMDDDSNMRITEAQAAIAKLTADLVQNSPSADELLALPFRVRQGFLRWLQGKLLDPEAGAAGTRG